MTPLSLQSAVLPTPEELTIASPCWKPPPHWVARKPLYVPSVSPTEAPPPEAEIDTFEVTLAEMVTVDAPMATFGYSGATPDQPCAIVAPVAVIAMPGPVTVFSTLTQDGVILTAYCGAVCLSCRMIPPVWNCAIGKEAFEFAIVIMPPSIRTY